MLTILQGDVIEQLRTLPDESVHCCVTSPPYWGLRDYGTAQWKGGDNSCDHAEPPRGGRNPETAEKQLTNAGTLTYQFAHDCGKCGARRIDSQIGLEKTPEEYVVKMVEVFREVRRVLRKDGTCWVNLGDSYATQGGKQPDDTEWRASQARAADRGYDVGGWGACRNKTQGASGRAANTAVSGLKPKDLCGVPWRVAFALQADGWWLRSDIIWAKPNPMPESVTDRPTKSHEYLFLLTKSANYFYDAEAIREPIKPWNNGECSAPKLGPNRIYGTTEQNVYKYDRICGANKRSVWTVATAPYPEAHFATYPPDLIKPCILAGTSAKGCCAKCGAPWERVIEKETTTQLRNLAGKNDNSYQRGRVTPRGSPIGDFHDLGTISSKTSGWQPTCKCKWNYDTDDALRRCTVLDPFAGSGTTGAVALELGRKAILIELNPKYVELIKTRCNITPGLQLA